MYRGSHNTRREVEIMDVFVANRALIVVTLMECMPFIEEKLLAVEIEEVLNHLYVGYKVSDGQSSTNEEWPRIRACGLCRGLESW
ncbi:hypothetical protein MRX96_023571 [Rhipicephalus microplus]